jgi:hypothetical protein
VTDPQESLDPAANPSVDPGPFGRAPWKVRLAVTAFSIALLLVAGEAMARRLVSREQETSLFRDHPLTWRMVIPGARTIPDPPADKVSSFAINRFGVRGASLKTLARPKDVYRILFLGDAQAFAARCPEEETYAGRVERQLMSLRGAGDPAIEVGNAGLPGASLPVLYATLVHRFLVLQPDLVVLTSAVEDVRLAEHLPPDDGLDALRPPPPAPPRLIDWLAGFSDLAHVIKAHLPPSARAEAGEALASPDAKRGIPLFRRYLHLLSVACRDARVDLAVMTEPTLEKSPLSPEERHALVLPTTPAETGPGSAEELRVAVDLWNEEVRNFASDPRERTALVDVARLVPKNLNHFENDLELTPVAHAIVANAVVNVVFGDKPAARRP